MPSYTPSDFAGYNLGDWRRQYHDLRAWLLAQRKEHEDILALLAETAEAAEDYMQVLGRAAAALGRLRAIEWLLADLGDPAARRERIDKLLQESDE